MAADNEELTRITEQVARELELFGKISQQTADDLRDAQVGVKGFSNAVRAVPKALGDAAGDMAKAMYKGEKGAAAFNKSIDGMASAADAATTILMAMIPGGPVVKAVVAGLGLLAKTLIKTAAEAEKAALEQSDALYTSFQKISRAGLATAGGTTQLGNDLRKFGTNVFDAGKTLEILAEHSQDLALMGKTAFQGADAFANISKESLKLRDQYRLLGMSQDEQNEAIAGYLRIQTRMGNGARMMGQDFDITAQAALKYAQEQDALSKVTGINRKEQEKAQEEAMRNQRYAATIDKLVAEGRTKEAENLRVMVQASGKLGPQFQKGMTDIASGFVNTEEARQVLLATQGDALKQFDEVKKGVAKSPEELDKAMQSIFNNTANFNKNMQPLAQAGVYDKMAGSYSEQRKAQEMTGDAYVQSMKDAREQVAKQEKGQDKLLKNQVDIDISQQNAMLATQELVQKGLVPATSAALTLAKAAEAAARALNDLAGVRAEQAKKDAAAKSEYEEAMKGASFMQKHLKVGQTAEQKYATAKYESQQRGGMSFDPNTGEVVMDELPPKPKAAAAAATPASPAAGPQSKGAAFTPGGGPSAVSPDAYVKFAGGTGDRAHFDKLDPSIQTAFMAMARDYNQLSGGDILQVNSAFRSPEEQAATNSGSNPKAAPGMSLHQQGRAIDIQSKQAEFLLNKGLLSQYGFKSGAQNFNDPPHIYAREGFEGMVTGPVSGYRPNIEMHGAEKIKIEPTASTNSSTVSNEFNNVSQMQASSGLNEAILMTLEELLRETKASNSISNKILQANR